MHTKSIFKDSLDELRNQGLFKQERIITTPQKVEITTSTAGEVLNFCANNYLGLANHPELIRAASTALEERGFGMASVRFICGTQDLHQQLERLVAQFLSMDDAILYTSCFDANTGLFETLLQESDVILSDALNHASIIDGIRLCKAKRVRYLHSDMQDLEQKLIETRSCRLRMIATDGVFSMDGDLAKLDSITELASKYDALVMVDDSHATGIVGPTGRGSAEFHAVLDKVDIITSTFGKALGGGSGGFTAAGSDIVELLRQRSRPYLFSNSMTPALVAAAIKALSLIMESNELQLRLQHNADYFRSHITQAGFDIKYGNHAIVPVMLYDAKAAQQMAQMLLAEGIYVVGFFYPVVAHGQARIRVQLSASHTHAHIDKAIDAFTKVGRELGLV